MCILSNAMHAYCKFIVLLLVIVQFQYSHSQESASPKGYWSINMGANYMRPTVTKYASISQGTNGYSYCDIKPFGGFGNYFEIGKGFKLKSYNENLTFNINIKLSYNWYKVKLSYYQFCSYSSLKQGEIAYNLNYPSLAIQTNNIIKLNSNYGIYHALSIKYSFLMSVDHYNSAFYMPYSLGFIIYLKRYDVIPIFSINFINFINKTDKFLGNSFGYSFKKNYFQPMELGLSIHLNQYLKH